MNQEERVFGVEKAEESSGFLLWQVTSLWQRELKRMLEQQHGITHAQFVLLASLLWLKGSKDEITQIDLSNHSKIDPMTTSTVLRTLQKKAYVKRQEHTTDTRAKAVDLTEAGMEITQKAVATVEAFDQLFFGALGHKTKELNALLYELTAFKADGSNEL